MLLELKNIHAGYNGREILRGLPLNINTGEIVCIIGPNGAGKSTAMKILTTYLYPTSGTASICGADILTDPGRVRELIGYLPEILPLYMDMDIREYLEFVGKARGLSNNYLKERISWVVEKCALKMMYRKLIRELSRGYKQRTALAQALLHDPEVIILDEPTASLDPHQTLEIHKLISQLSKDKTVMLSTHILREAEAIVDKIVVISRGRIVGDGTVKELYKKVTGHNNYSILLECPASDLSDSLTMLDQVISADVVDKKENINTYMIKVGDVDTAKRLISNRLLEMKVPILTMYDEVPSIEQIFLKLTETEYNN